MTDPFTRAKAIAGGPSALAQRLTAIGCYTTVDAIHRWWCVPRNKLKAVAAVTGMRQCDLRPDLFRAPRASPRAENRPPDGGPAPSRIGGVGLREACK